MTSGTLHWEIHGDFITNMAREKLLDSYRSAYNFLSDSFPSMTDEQINDILKGEKRLTGINDLLFEDELDDVKKLHVDEINSLSHTAFFHKGNYYRPYLRVTSYGENDMEDGTSHLGSTYHVEGRAKHYIDNPDDILYKGDEYVYICKLVTRDLPIWIKDKDLTFETCTGTDYVEDTGHDHVYGTLDDTPSIERLSLLADFIGDRLEADENSSEESMKDYKELIDAQAKVDGYIDLIDREGNNYGRVPKAPFYQWAFARISASVLPEGLLPDWSPVTPSGLKLPNDCEFHSDWMIGGGFDLWEDYMHNDDLVACSRYMQRNLQREHLNFECVVLASNERGHTSGNTRLIRCAKDAEYVEAGDIIVIPNAGINFTQAFLKATSEGGGVICEVGNKVAHLCKISRESDVIIVQEDNCMEKYRFSTLVSIHTDNGTISILA